MTLRVKFVEPDKKTYLRRNRTKEKCIAFRAFGREDSKHSTVPFKKIQILKCSVCVD